MPEKNRLGLIAYLASVGIDANIVSTENVDETGYDERQYQPDGRPIYSEGFVVRTVRKEWPSPVVYENVVHLLKGGSEADLKAEPKAKAPAAPKAKTDE